MEHRPGRLPALALLAMIAAVAAAAPATAVMRPPAANVIGTVRPGADTSKLPPRNDALVIRLRDAGATRATASAVAAAALTTVKPSRVSPVFASATTDAKQAAASSLGAVYRLSFAAPIDTAAAAQALAADPRVAWAEPVYRAQIALSTNDPYLGSSGAWGQPFGDLWGLTAIGAQTAWNTTQGTGVLVAVVDTGSDFTHVDLAANLHQGSDWPPNGFDDDGNGFVDDGRGWDFANGDNNPTDDYGHGTHVAGTIAAVGNNGIGVVGVAWKAKILSVKGFDSSGFGDSDELAASIVYAKNRGAKVINNSWGMMGYSQVVEDALQAARAAGVVVIAAAGNNGADAGGFHPCSSRLVICVGAHTPNGQRAWFSNYGSALDLLAPGGGDFGDPYAPNILSTLAAGAPPQSTVVGGQYVRFQGTSMASPHAAGVAALLLAAVPGMNPEQVRQAFRRSAGPSYAPGWDTDSGYGALAAAAAIADAQAGTGAARLLTPPGDLHLGGAVRGTATCTGFTSWELAVGTGTAPTTWTVIQTGNTPVVDGALATWDPGVLGDGSYILRLTVHSSSGRTYEDRLEAVLDRVAIHTPVELTSFRSGDLIPIGGSAVIGDMTSFEIQWANPTDPDGFIWRTSGMTLAGGGVGPVIDGPLATWDTTGLTRAAHYFLQVVVHRSGGPDEVSQIWHSVIVDPTIHPGWPRPLPVLPEYQIFNVDQNATVADLDGDGRPEMMIAQGNAVHAFRHDGSELPGWPRTPSLLPDEHFERSPAVGDLDGDGPPEVVVTSSAWKVFIFEHDGTLRYQTPPTEFLGLTAAIGNVTGDARKEIVLTGEAIPEVIILDRLGNQLVPPSGIRCALPTPPGATDTLRTMPAPPALADLDGDGKDEIVVLQRNARLEVHVCRADGTELPGFPVDLGPSSYAWMKSAAVVGDLDGDGRLEIVVGSNECKMFALDRQGAMRPGWPWQPPFPVIQCGPIALSELDGNRTLEVVVGGLVNGDPGGGVPAYTGVLWSLGSNGQPLPGWPQYYGWGSASGPMVADLDDDGFREIVIDSDLAGEIFNSNIRPYAVRGSEADGTPVAGFPRPIAAALPNGLVNTAAVADFDGDGQLELFWVSGKLLEDDGTHLARLYLWDLPAAVRPSRFDWPMYRHDAAHTGAQLGTGCAPGTCGPSLPFIDSFESGSTAAWSPGPP